MIKIAKLKLTPTEFDNLFNIRNKKFKIKRGRILEEIPTKNFIKDILFDYEICIISYIDLDDELDGQIAIDLIYEEISG